MVNSGSEEEQLYSIVIDRPPRTIRTSVKYGFEDSVFYALITSNSGPITFQDVIGSQEKSKLIEVIIA